MKRTLRGRRGAARAGAGRGRRRSPHVGRCGGVAEGRAARGGRLAGRCTALERAGGEGKAGYLAWVGPHRISGAFAAYPRAQGGARANRDVCLK